MSPWNSYFKDIEVAYLLKETISRYWRAAIMVADVPAIATYLAMWYSLSKAREKAILKWNNLKNRTKRVLQDMGFDQDSILIIDRDNDVKDNPEYLKHFEKVMSLYNNNPAFQRSVNETSTAVLINAEKTVNQENIQQATHYLLSEISFLEYAPQFFDVDGVAYVYHKNRRVYEDYIAWIFDNIPRSHLDFILLEAPYETYMTLSEWYKSRYEVILERKFLRCTFVPYFDYFKVEENGTYSGTFFDIMQKVSQTNNLRLEFVEQSGYWVLSSRLNSVYADVFCSPVWPTKKRRLELFFSKPLFQSHIYAYISTASKYVNLSLEELQSSESLRIAVKENDIHHELAIQYFPKARLVRVPQLSDPGEVVKFVMDDRADLTFREDKLVDQYLSQQWFLNSALLKKDKDWAPFATYDNCFALPWGEFELKKMIDEEM